MTTVIETIASLLDTLRRNDGVHAPSSGALDYIVANYLPSGSGVDGGCSIDTGAQRPSRIKIDCGFHHMDECGGYDGWTRHTIIVEPNFTPWASIRVTGVNRDGIKDYLGDLFAYALQEHVARSWDAETQSWVFKRD